jgi:hypothetical protein
MRLRYNLKNEPLIKLNKSSSSLIALLSPDGLMCQHVLRVYDIVDITYISD